MQSWQHQCAGGDADRRANGQPRQHGPWVGLRRQDGSHSAAQHSSRRAKQRDPAEVARLDPVLGQKAIAHGRPRLAPASPPSVTSCGSRLANAPLNAPTQAPQAAKPAGSESAAGALARPQTARQSQGGAQPGSNQGCARIVRVGRGSARPGKDQAFTSAQQRAAGKVRWPSLYPRSGAGRARRRYQDQPRFRPA